MEHVVGRDGKLTLHALKLWESRLRELESLLVVVQYEFCCRRARQTHSDSMRISLHTRFFILVRIPPCKMTQYCLAAMEGGCMAHATRKFIGFGEDPFTAFEVFKAGAFDVARVPLDLTYPTVSVPVESVHAEAGLMFAKPRSEELAVVCCC